MQRKNEPREPEPLKGMVAGAIGGLAGAFVMNQFQTKVLPRVEKAMGVQERGGGGGGGSKPATVKAADKLASAVGVQLSEAQEKRAGPAMHYAMGAVSGAILGLGAEYAPATTVAQGAGFGAAVWAVADEMAVPALGLSKPPLEYPVKTHAEALAAHLVYGLTTETVREGVRGVL